MSHKHSVFDKDTHFIIDPVTRAITTTSEKLHVMQYDQNSETLTFEMPRYIEGHELNDAPFSPYHSTEIAKK